MSNLKSIKSNIQNKNLLIDRLNVSLPNYQDSSLTIKTSHKKEIRWMFVSPLGR